MPQQSEGKGAGSDVAPVGEMGSDGEGVEVAAPGTWGNSLPNHIISCSD